MFKSLLYKTGYKISVSLSLESAYRFAVFVAGIHRWMSKKDREAVEANIKVVFPQANPRQVNIYTKDIFDNFSKYLVDFFRFGLIDKKDINDRFEIEGLEIVDNALKQKKGVILVSGHIASWEIGGAAMALLGYPIDCVALKHRDKNTDEFFIRQREDKGLGVIPLGNAAFRCLMALKKNRLLALLGDRDFTHGGITIDFFGKPTSIPKGPAAFALKTGAPLVMVVVSRKDDDTFRFKFQGPVEIAPSGDTEKDIVVLTKKYLNILEGYIKEYPGQWLIFRRFWEPLGTYYCD